MRKTCLFQVGSMLINRVANTDSTWHQEVTNAAPRVSPIVDLTLDDVPVTRAIDNLNFIQMKRKYTNNIIRLLFKFGIRYSLNTSIAVFL